MSERRCEVKGDFFRGRFAHHLKVKNIFSSRLVKVELEEFKIKFFFESGYILEIEGHTRYGLPLSVEVTNLQSQKNDQNLKS